MASGPMATTREARWALITGASAGIGAAFARVFADAGYHVVLTARREERLRMLAGDIEKEHGVSTLVLPADLADGAAPAAIHAACAREGIEVTALVNNAGLGSKGDFHVMPWADHEAFLQVMVTSVVHLTHLFLPEMLRRGEGHIINVASVAGLVPGAPGRTLYGGSKAFLIKFSEALALEHQGRVHVTAVCPGFTYSEFHDVTGTRAAVSRLPRFMWMDADTVAREGFRAVMAGEVVRVNGVANRAITWFTRMLPDGVARAIVRRQSRRLGPA